MARETVRVFSIYQCGSLTLAKCDNIHPVQLRLTKQELQVLLETP